jgi:hypothetical protein
VKIEEVHFNHDTSAASSDALNIRKNAAGGLIVAPEWKDGQSPQPAAYASAAIGNEVTIKCRFSGGPPNGSRKIRAIDAYLPPAVPSGCVGWLLSLIGQILRALFGNILGDAQKATVAFDGAGNSGLESFVLINHKLTTSSVGVHTTTWKWQVKHNKKWLDFGTTQHKIYLVLDIPNGPWDQSPAGNNTQLPWTDALDKACLWALGAKSKDEAAAKITEAINGHPNQSYTPVTMFGFTPPYQLTSYMNQIDSGLPFSLNCTDCADAVTTFANLLGCDLWEGRFFNMVTRRFLPLNGNPAVDGDWVSWSWGYHEICWLNAIGQNQNIYDGCLQVDMDDNYSDAVHIPRNPIKMRFGMNGPDDYRFRLIQSGTGNLENIPRRRAVG